MPDDRDATDQGSVEAVVAWQRLDVPGAEVARLLRRRDGWEIAGTVVVVEDGILAALRYRVCCTAAFHTTAAEVQGHLGRDFVERVVKRDASGWRCNGSAVAGLEAAIDVDLAFTPATNLLPLRRLRLEPGRRHTVVSAWLRFPELDLVPLGQSYERIGAHEVRYASPSLTGTLVLHPSGFPREYPGLWRMVGEAG